MTLCRTLITLDLEPLDILEGHFKSRNILEGHILEAPQKKTPTHSKKARHILEIPPKKTTHFGGPPPKKTPTHYWRSPPKKTSKPTHFWRSPQKITTHFGGPRPPKEPTHQFEKRDSLPPILPGTAWRPWRGPWHQPAAWRALSARAGGRCGRLGSRSSSRRRGSRDDFFCGGSGCVVWSS